MYSTLGYHTFMISGSLTQDHADSIFKAFKKYRDKTDEITIITENSYSNDPHGRHYRICYKNRNTGIIWKIRFSNRGYSVNGELKPCSIKAIINPKILADEKSYIAAATSEYLDKVLIAFNSEARRITPMLGCFTDYSLQRVDYCVNFNVNDFKISGKDIPQNLPEIVMGLFRQGNIPNHFTREYEYGQEFYLSSKSVVVNCYWKHYQLSNDFSDCDDLEESYNIIRFEIQCKYPKVRTLTNRIKSSDNYSGEREFDLLKIMLSDDACMDIIRRYYQKVLKLGDYYSMRKARDNIIKQVNSQGKMLELLDTLKTVRRNNGIAAVKAMLTGTQAEKFRKALRYLEDLKINPVTIPDDLGIDYIRNPLNNYLDLIYDQLDREREQDSFERGVDYFSAVPKSRQKIIGEYNPRLSDEVLKIFSP